MQMIQLGLAPDVVPWPVLITEIYMGQMVIMGDYKDGGVSPPPLLWSSSATPLRPATSFVFC